MLTKYFLTFISSIIDKMDQESVANSKWHFSLLHTYNLWHYRGKEAMRSILDTQIETESIQFICICTITWLLLIWCTVTCKSCGYSVRQCDTTQCLELYPVSISSIEHKRKRLIYIISRMPLRGPFIFRTYYLNGLAQKREQECALPIDIQMFKFRYTIIGIITNNGPIVYYTTIS